MNEEEKLKLEARRWRIRRRIALASFTQLIFLTLFFSLSGFFLSAETSKIVKDFNPIIISLIGFYSSIVMLYMGAVTYSDTATSKTVSTK